MHICANNTQYTPWREIAWRGVGGDDASSEMFEVVYKLVQALSNELESLEIFILDLVWLLHGRKVVKKILLS